MKEERKKRKLHRNGVFLWHRSTTHIESEHLFWCASVYKTSTIVPGVTTSSSAHTGQRWHNWRAPALRSNTIFLGCQSGAAWWGTHAQNLSLFISARFLSHLRSHSNFPSTLFSTGCFLNTRKSTPILDRTCFTYEQCIKCTSSIFFLHSLYKCKLPLSSFSDFSIAITTFVWRVKGNDFNVPTDRERWLVLPQPQ